MGLLHWLKNRGKLKPCPNCNGTKYGYGFSFTEYLQESLDVASAVRGVAEGNLAKVLVKGGGGIFTGLWQSFKNEVIDDIPSTPLLRCKKCFSFAIVCPHCGSMQLLEEYPPRAAIIECQKCKGRFGYCERDPDFDSLVK